MMAEQVYIAKIEIMNEMGLHARPAAMLVEVSSRFQSLIHVAKDDLEVNAKSIMGVMMLAAGQGTTLTLTAEGSDCRNAIKALVELIEGKFDEEK